MTCGPQTLLVRDPLAATLRCPRCGDIQRVPALPLFVVTGASGAGKTAVTGPLRRLLPDCDVFDTDVLPLQLAALGWDTWRNAWLRLAHGIALNGRVTVLCGSLLRHYARRMTPEALVRSGTSWRAVPFVPEIRLLTAAEPFGLWDQSGRDAPPFWAFPWGGGQGLARYLLDNPATVRGRTVLDVASGSGLVAIAAAKAGAASVLAGDVDVNAVTAIRVNAEANEVAVTARIFDLAEEGTAEEQVILAADVFYQRELAQLALGFLRDARLSGAEVLVADPGRAFLPAAALTPLISYEVPVLCVIEETRMKAVTIYRLA